MAHPFILRSTRQFHNIPSSPHQAERHNRTPPDSLLATILGPKKWEALAPNLTKWKLLTLADVSNNAGSHMLTYNTLHRLHGESQPGNTRNSQPPAW